MTPVAWCTVKDMGSGVRQFNRASALLYSSCETLYKLLNLSEPQLLCRGGEDSSIQQASVEHMLYARHCSRTQ